MNIVLKPRADIHKCIGTPSDLCSRCIRKIAPEHEKQQWTPPSIIVSEICVNFADLNKYQFLFKGK